MYYQKNKKFPGGPPYIELTELHQLHVPFSRESGYLLPVADKLITAHLKGAESSSYGDSGLIHEGVNGSPDTFMTSEGPYLPFQSSRTSGVS